MGTWTGLIWIGAMLLTHEWGHYLVAKQQGVYKSWGIHPFGGLVVNMRYYLQGRWNYLVGIVTSCLAFPLFWVLEPALRDEWWAFFVIAIGLGAFDLYPFFFYKSCTRQIDEARAKGISIPELGVPIDELFRRKKR